MSPSQLIINKIQSYNKKKSVYIIFAGLFNFTVSLLLILTTAIIADMTFYFSTSSRLIIISIICCLTLLFFYRSILAPIISFIYFIFSNNYTSVTREIGHNFPGIGDRITNIYQLISGTVEKESIDLRDYVVDTFAREIEDTDFNKSLQLKDYIIPIPLILLVYISSIFLTISLNDYVVLSIKRLANPFADYYITPNYAFTVHPGTTNLISGKPLLISAKYQGPILNKCLLKYSYKNDMSYQIIEMSKKNNIYQSVIENLKKPISYYIQGVPQVNAEWCERIYSKEYDITVLYPPYISEMNIKVYPPAYTNLPIHYNEKNIGDIIAYKSSKINLNAKVNKQLSGAEIVFTDNSTISASITGEQLNAYFHIYKNMNYHFKIMDQDSVYNQSPIEYSITVLDDLSPSVEILDPDKDIELAPDGNISLLIEGSDDFGFSELTLNYQIISNLQVAMDTSWYKISIPLSLSSKKYFKQYYLWDFTILAVSFDDAIKYYVSLSDNDLIDGPKYSKSSIFFIRFPSLKQIFDDFSNQQNESITEMEELIRESKELNNDLKKINREIKREDKLNWEQKRELEALLEKQKKIQDKLEEIQQELDENIKKLENEQLVSTQVLEKYNQLQDLFKQIMTPELMETMKEVKRLFDNIDKEEINKSIQDFQLDQEQLLKKLDQSLELFKKVKLEQELDRLLQMAKKLSEEQSTISEQLNKQLSPEAMKRLEAKETSQQETLENLSDSIDPLLENSIINELPKTEELLQDSKDYIERNNLDSIMKHIQSLLAVQNQKFAKQESDKLSQSLQNLFNQLQRTQKSMESMQKEKIRKKMIRSTEDLISLSQDEEQLLQKTQNLSDLSDQFRDITVTQYNLMEDMDQVIKELIQLSKETFCLSPELSKSLNMANMHMKESISELENRNQNKARDHQMQAMSACNRSAMMMQESMEKMMNSSSSGLGFEQFMQQMQQLAGQQMKLNQETLSFFQGQGNNGRLSMEKQTQLSKMMSEQEAIRQALNDLYNNMGHRGDVLGRIDQMGEEMEEVVKDMKSRVIDRKTIDRQQKILSRMLDSQRSIQEKEYSHKRIAETGKDYIRKSPSENMNTIDLRKEKLNRDLIKALQEGYNPDYEKLIEDYFKKLNEAEVKN